MSKAFETAEAESGLMKRQNSNSNYSALEDIWRGLCMIGIWLLLSWKDFENSYRRTAFGVLWVIVSFAFFAGVKILIFSNISSAETGDYYSLYIMTGFWVWMFLMQTVPSAPLTFVNVQGWIKSEPLPYSLYVYQSVMREYYNFLLTGLVVAVGVFYFGDVTKINYLGLACALCFLAVNAFALKLLFGVVGARIRDLAHLVRAIMLPLMFLTPIFWQPKQMGDLMAYLWWNPFYHYIEIIRGPITDGVIPLESWQFTGVSFGLLLIAGYTVFGVSKRRIIYWL